MKLFSLQCNQKSANLIAGALVQYSANNKLSAAENAECTHIAGMIFDALAQPEPVARQKEWKFPHPKSDNEWNAPVSPVDESMLDAELIAELNKMFGHLFTVGKHD